METEFYMEHNDMLRYAQDKYCSIKDNSYIPSEIKDAWIGVCVSYVDVYELTK